MSWHTIRKSDARVINELEEDVNAGIHLHCSKGN